MRRENDKFHLMRVFHEVAVCGSFTKAATALSMTTSSVSKAVNQLEQQLQTKLLHRTTRHQSLTDTGREYVNAAKVLLNQVAALEERIQGHHQQVSGKLRITMPAALGQFFLAPRLHEFLTLHPKVDIELIMEEDIIDITEQGYDVAIRSVNLPPTSSLYSVELGQHQQKLVASPEFVARHKDISTPADLQKLQLLNYKGQQIAHDWVFMNNDSFVTVSPNGSYTTNSYYALLMAAKNGLGIANLYQYMVDDEIKAGNLVHILPQWQQRPRSRYAIFQQRRDSSPKLHHFVDFVESLFQ